MQMNAKANIDYYDKMSNVYDKKHQIDMKDFSLFCRQLSSLFRPKKFKRKGKVLDCGCGTGRGALKFCRLGCNVTAVDISPEIVKQCKKNADHYGYKIQTQAEDCRNLSFASQTFDYVSTSAALHHMEELETCLQEFYRVTKPGGALILIAEPKKCRIRPDWVREKKEQLSAKYDRKVAGVSQSTINPDVYIFDTAKLTKVLEKVGYTDIRICPFFFVSSLYRDLLYFRIYNQKVRKWLLEVCRIIDTYLLFWLPKSYYALFDLVAWKPEK